ncbi:phasin family protein [Andreprevotia lacus DSM 23236]|jgi:phasin family protein|uniref:Phasin family protein n=1 Tax=Andreprevotia lacus DSM 23236 TaxID=1121001 RepID=A0A1W1XDC3_9NEIS|nr:phasin family protein [Andreprevotia lacus]SMC21926.1 phasin family protein [Andreprevotia lacus DSM 23236]
MSYVNQFTEIQQANLEKSLRLTNIALSSVERLVNLQLTIARDLLSENAQTAKALSEVKDVNGLVALQRQLAQPAVEKSLSVARSVFDSASATQNELNALVEEQVLSFNQNIVSALDKAVETAPAGAGAAVSVLRSAVESAAQAYDAASKSTKKIVTELADAAVAGAEQSVKAASRGKAA